MNYYAILAMIPLPFLLVGMGVNAWSVRKYSPEYWIAYLVGSVVMIFVLSLLLFITGMQRL